MSKKVALIIGAGPAGLTAGHELLEKTDVTPLLIEKSDSVGGLAKTIDYNGNRMDIGGHRFFTKSDSILNWWLKFLPLQQNSNNISIQLAYQGKTTPISLDGLGPDPDESDMVMLIRKRKSHILYSGHFFDYPLTLSLRTLSSLGLLKSLRMLASYIWAKITPIQPEITLQDFMINRFGKELYETFFRSYTEKVWGIPCNQISADWGKQRIKGLSLFKALADIFQRSTKTDDPFNKKRESSLTQYFLYPKYGPGQLWELVAQSILKQGGEIDFNTEPLSISIKQDRYHVELINRTTNQIKTIEADYLISSIPIPELIQCLGNRVPIKVRSVAHSLTYRSFITIGILVKKLASTFKTRDDNWIYIQEPNVKVGRVQIYNNWSPYLISNPDYFWLGSEYFCTIGDPLWNLSDDKLRELAIDELVYLGLIQSDDVIDSHVVRVEKAYPVYNQAYHQLKIIKEFTNSYKNLYLIGRNGLHRYNNQDHSMLTAMQAVENILRKIKTNQNIWENSLDDSYIEV